MLTIRLKGKYIIMMSVLLLVLAGVIYASSSRVAAGQDLQQAEAAGDWERYVQILKEQYPNPEDAAEKLYFSAEEDAGGAPDFQRNTIYIFPTWSHWGEPGAQEVQLEWAIEKLLLLREHFPESSWAQTTHLMKLAKNYYALGDYEWAEQYAKETNNVLLLARIYLDNGNYQAALQVTEASLTKQADSSLEIHYAKGRALMGLERWQEAKVLFTELAAKADVIFTQVAGEDKQAERTNVDHWEKIAQHQLERIKTLQHHQGKGQISGNVWLGNEKLAGVRIYLLDQTVYRGWSSSTEVAEMRQVVSAEDGSFHFANVLPGRYALGVAVPILDVEGYTLQEPQEFTLQGGQIIAQDVRFVGIASAQEPLGGKEIDGDAEFRWDAVEGAAYYDVSVTFSSRDKEKNHGSYSTVLRPGVTENKLLIDVDEELHKARFYPSYGHSDGKLNPNSVFGMIFPGGEFAWYVTAYNSEGQKINTSNGYGAIVGEDELPIFRIKGEFTAADRLVWDLEYEQAIDVYEEDLQSNPADTHALLMLARIHQFGIRFDEPKLAEAAIYYERLLQEENTPEARKALAGVYEKLNRHQEAYELTQSLLETDVEGWDTHFALAKADVQLGRPKDALMRLEKAVVMEYGQYARAYPVVLSLALGDVESALWFAEQVDGGERYVALLNEYKAAGYTFSLEVRKSIIDGEYRKASQMLTNAVHDQFLQGLLLYLGGEGTEDMQEWISREMEPGLLQDLLRKMVM
ncbi:MAG: tetratricopeptide repeat protein [Firmicutes bacterium]|nr:tetratricopeptide repeat protein [Bacillota bacterium]